MTQPRWSRPFLQAALNGDRMHPAAPHTPAQVAAEALATAISLRLPPRCSPTARLNKSSSDQASSDGVGTASCIGSAGSDVPVRWLASL
jgi:hypothetical protein